MTDETLLSAPFPLPLRPEIYTRGEEDRSLPSPVWAGMLDEFRNHLQRLVAGTEQVRDSLPRSVASLLAPTLAEMEGSVDSLTILTGWMNTVTNPGVQVISDIDDVIERALGMAKPFIHADVKVVSVGSRVGAVRNRRGAVECALAALLVSLDRSPAILLEHRGHDCGDDLGVVSGLASNSSLAPGPVSGPVRPARKGLSIEVFSGRGHLVIEIESTGVKPAPSWHWSLAERLAAMVGGTLELLSDRVGVALRFQ